MAEELEKKAAENVDNENVTDEEAEKVAGGIYTVKPDDIKIGLGKPTNTTDR